MIVHALPEVVSRLGLGTEDVGALQLAAPRFEVEQLTRAFTADGWIEVPDSQVLRLLPHPGLQPPPEDRPSAV